MAKTKLKTVERKTTVSRDAVSGAFLKINGKGSSLNKKESNGSLRESVNSTDTKKKSR